MLRFTGVAGVAGDFDAVVLRLPVWFFRIEAFEGRFDNCFWPV